MKNSSTLINIIGDAKKRTRLRYASSKISDRPETYKITVFEEVHYPHPDVPDLATIQVLQHNYIMDITEYHNLFEIAKMLYLAEKSLSRNIKN